MTTTPRILIVDDQPAIHEDFRRILSSRNPAQAQALKAAAADFLGQNRPEPAAPPTYRLDFAQQGLDGIGIVREAMNEDQPIQVAFVDVRMPPGLDGLETATRMMNLDPRLQIVLCTAYSD
ncbi:MAG: hypothetical protein IT440_00040, partial [Phycisphaeraceae bacterium]|nr:hypothetical protein [Phycisphaeraceae bacterium]